MGCYHICTQLQGLHLQMKQIRGRCMKPCLTSNNLNSIWVGFKPYAFAATAYSTGWLQMSGPVGRKAGLANVVLALPCPPQPARRLKEPASIASAAIQVHSLFALICHQGMPMCSAEGLVELLVDDLTSLNWSVRYRQYACTGSEGTDQ